MEFNLVLPIEPNTKPRQTVRDKWKKRPVVIKYRLFADGLRLLCMEAGYQVTSPLSLTFVVRMPDSWSKKKKALYNGQPHESTPDLDNLIKAFKDALMEDDCSIHTYGQMKKIWGEEGCIIIHLNDTQAENIKHEKIVLA